MADEPVLNARQKILKSLDESLTSITVDNGYNFDAGLVDEEKGINKVMKDFSPTTKLTGQFPCCYSKLGLSDPKEIGNGTKQKVSTQSYKTVECYIGIAVSSDKGSGALRDELEKAIQDLESFVNMTIDDRSKGLRLYEIPEVIHVTPPKSTPFYDNGGISGWAVTQFQIKYKDFN